MANEQISHELFMSEYANDDFWGRIPYLLGVQDGMVFGYKTIKKTIDSGAVPDLKVVESNIENATKMRDAIEKEMLRGGFKEKLCNFVRLLYGCGLIDDDTEQEIRLDYIENGLLDDDINRIFGGKE